LKRIVACSVEDCSAFAENPDLEEPLCASHSRALRKSATLKVKEKKPAINKVSDKMAEALRQYAIQRDRFLIGKRCAVEPDEPATTVHHMKGRGFGFADDWAKERGIILLLDERYWLPCSLEGHRFIELNPTFAKEKGWSFDRLEKI
jgi:hypothetical protein